MDRIVPGARRAFSDAELQRIRNLELDEAALRLWRDGAPVERLERALRAVAGLPERRANDDR